LTIPSHYAQSYWENNPSFPQTFTNGTLSVGVPPGPVNSKLRILANDSTPFGAIIYNHSAITSPGSLVTEGVYYYVLNLYGCNGKKIVYSDFISIFHDN